MAAHRHTHRHTARAAAILVSTLRPWPLKPVCLAVLGMAAWMGMPAAWALPDGAVPTHGQAQLQGGGNGMLTIHQTSAQAGFDWRSFSIAAGERVQVLQPDARSILFNRVTGADPSLILGQLQANGRVFLSNPRGVVFGAGSQVDVGGLLATTLSVNRTAGADGRWQLSGGDAATGVLRMDGSIRAPGGTVALVGPQLSVGGNVLAGRLGLAAAGAVQVDVDGDGLIFFNLRDEHLAARLQLLPGAHLLAQSAELRAAARSQFADTVLNLEGVVRAQGLVQQDGQVVIGGAAPQILVDGGVSGIVRVAGTLDASATGPGQTGGQVRVLGDRVWLDSTARLDTRGDAGGGLLHVGGAWQGRGPERNAMHTRVSAGAQLDASAIRLGDGGQVVVWADDSTVFDGAIRARGGLLGGDGGAVETSGLLRLGIGSGTVDAGAQPGFRAGLWLLDPQNITVVATAPPAPPPPVTSDGTEAWNEAPGTTLTITATALQTPSASVLLQATRNISINTSVTLTTGESFTAQAGGDVDVASGATITTIDQPITLEANRIFNSQTPGGPAYNGTPSTSSGSGRVSMLGTLAAGTGAIGISQTGSTGQHVLGGSFSGASLAVTGSAQLASGVTFNVDTLALPDPVALVANTSITVASGKSLTIAGAIGDGALPGPAFSLTKAGAGSLNLSGTNTYRGGTVVSGGTLQVGAEANLGAAGTAVTLQNGSTLAWSAAGGTSQTLGRAVRLGVAGGSLSVADTLTLTASGVVSDASLVLPAVAGALVKQGAGALVLSGTNTYTGGTTVSNGTLVLSGDDALPGTGALTVGGSSSVDLGSAPRTVGVFTLDTSGSVANGNLSASRYDLQAGAISANLQGGAGGLAKTGAGQVTLSGTNIYTGDTTVSNGTLVLAGAAALPGGGAVTVSGDGSVDLGGAPRTVGVFTLATSGSVANGNLSASRYDLQAGAISANLQGGAGGLAKTGAGQVTLSGTNIYTGDTTVSNGTLVLAGAAALPGGGAVTVSGNGSIDLGSAPRTVGVFTLDTSGSVTNGNLSASRFDLQAGAISANLQGGAGGLAKTGAGQVTLSGTNIYTGDTTVSNGTLVLAGAAALPGGGAVTVSGDGSVDLGGAPRTVGVFTLATSGSVTNGNLSASRFDLQAGAISANLQGGAGGLAKTGAGQVTLSGTNAYAGDTTVSSGTLVLAGAGALPGTSALTVNGSGSVDLGGVMRTVGAFTLATSGSVANGALSASGFDLQAGTVSANLQDGVDGLAKTGAGQVTLSGTNTYTGSTTVSNGTLVLAGAGALPGTSALTVSGSGSVDLGGVTRTVGAFTLATSGSVGNGNLSASRFDLQAGTVGANLQDGAGGLAKTGAGQVTLSGTNTYTGDTTVSAGALVLAGGVALPGAGALTVGGSGSVDLGGATFAVGQFTLDTTGSVGNGSLSSSLFQLRAGSLDASLVASPGGPSLLSKQGSATVALTRASPQFTGLVTVSGGTLALDGADALSASSGVSLDGLPGTRLQVNASNVLPALDGNSASTVAIAAGSTLTVGRVGGNPVSSVSGNITGGGRLVARSGSLTLTGSNSFGGGTSVAGGTLVLGGGNALADGGSVQVAAGANLQLDASETVGALTGAGNVALGANTLTVTPSTNTSFSGGIAGTGGLVMQGAGSLTLAGSNNPGAGTRVATGTLVLAHAGALPDSAAVQVVTGATLELQADKVLGALTGNGAVALGPHLLTLDSTANTTFGGAMAGGGGLVKRGSGVLTLSGSNQFDGGTTVQDGTLRLLGGQALPDAAPLLMAGGTLQVDASERVGAPSGSGAVTLANGRVLTVGSATDSSFAGSFGGGGALVKQGTGKLSLTGASSHGGGTRVAGGVLAITADAALGDAAATLTLDGGSLRASGGVPLALAAQRTVAVGAAGGTLDVDAGTTLQLPGRLDGAGSLAKSGTGTLALSGASTGFTGAVQVDAGRLVLQQAQALGAANAVDVAAGGTLDLGAAVRLGPLSGSGVVQFNGLTLTTGGADSRFSGTLAGGGVLQQLGGGRLTLDAATGFTGSTQVLGGTLALAHADALTGSPVSVAPGATLAVLASSRIQSLAQPGATGGQVVLANGATLSTGAGADTSFAGTISGGGALRKVGSGRFTLAGNSSYSGGTLVDAGVLQGDSTSLQGDFRVAGQLVFNQASNGSFGGDVDGSGSLVKQGGGALQLTGRHQHSGGTQVLAGQLQLAGGQAVPDGGAVSLAAGTTLQVDASETLARITGTGRLQLQPGTVLTLGDVTNFGFDGTLAGSGGLVKQGSGQLLLQGAGGHSGSTLVQGGSLALAAPDVLAASTVTLAGQPGVELRLLGDARIGALASAAGPAVPAVVLDGFSLAAGGNGGSTLFAGSTQGPGSLVKQGAGTLTLAGSNNHTGATQVQGGSLVLLGAQALATASPVQVDAGASLVLQAPQTIGTLAGDGGVQLGNFQLTMVMAADSLFSGQISGSGGLAKQGVGRLTLAGANSFSGAVDLQQGTLALAGGAALADGAAVRLSAGSVLQAADNETLGALSGTGGVVLGAGTLTTTVEGSHTLSGTLSGAGRLAKAGAGSLTLAGANTHTGGLALLGGSLVVASDSALGALPTAAQPASLLFDGGTLRASSSFTLAAQRSLVLQGAGGTLQVDAGQTLLLPATLADGASAGALAKAGAGTLALRAGADSNRSGATALQGGQLTLQRDGQLGTAAGALVLDGGTLQVDQTLRLADARTLQLGAAGGTLQVANGATLQLGGLVADSAGASGGALTKTGAGSLVLDGALDNAFTGATRLLGGSLVIQRDGQLGAAPAVATSGQLLIDGGTLQIDGDTVLAASRGLMLGAGGATLQVEAGRVAGLAAAMADVPGAGGGSLVKTGAGLLRLQSASASTSTGATQVLGGTLALAADAQLGAAPTSPTPGHLVLDGGTLQAESGFTLAAQRGLQLGAAGGTVHVADGQQLAYGGVLASSSANPSDGTLTKAGGGRLLLDGAAANTYAGATHLRAGTLAIGRDDHLGAAPAATTPGHLLLDGGTLRIDGSTTLAAQRGMALGALGAVLDVATGASVAYNGVLADAAAGVPGGIDKAGAGSLVLGGVATHTGTTRVLGGRLATSAPQRLPQGGAVQLANGASLVLGGDQNLAALGDAPNPGGVPADASALVDLGAFTLRLDTSADDGRSFYSGAFTGSGGQLLKQGGGTLQLAGSGVGRNLVTVDAGLLVSLGGNSLSTEAVVTVAPGAALRLMAPVTVQSLDLAGRLSGPGGLTASSQVDLRDAVVDTTVATAALHSQGNSLVNADVQAGSSLLTGGVLTLGGTGSLQTTTLALQGGATVATQVPGQLRGLPAVDVADGRLQLAGAEQVASLRLAGTLAGPGSLGVAGATLLQGASVLTGLDTDTLRSTGRNAIDAAVVARSSATLAGGSLALGAGGSLATPLLTLEAGTLDTGTGAGLATGGRLVVQRPATLLLGTDQRLASLDLAGTLGAAPAAAAGQGAAAGQQRALAEAGPAGTAPQLRVEGAVVLDGATVFTPLSAGTLASSGATTLAAPVLASGGTTVTGGLLGVAASGQLTTPSLQVQAGGLATGAAQGIQADTQLALAAGTTLQLGGDQVLARLVDLGAAGAAPAQVLLGSFSLAAGADGADGIFSGRFSGDGSVAKQGAGTWLLRSDQAHGDTRIEAGTLQLGDAGSSAGNRNNGGSLGRGAVVNDGLLRFDRSDTVRITQTISGSGSLQQAGSGSLVIAGTGLSYTGDTIVSAGSLRTEGADRLPDATHLRLAAGTSLATGGDERLGAVTAAGAVSLGGSLASTGNQLYNGPVSITATGPVTLSAPLARIEALHVGNQWGTQPLSIDAGQLLLGAGRASAAADAPWANLTLGQVTLRGLADGGAAGAAADSQIDANQLQIGAAAAPGAAATGDARVDGQLTLLAGNLALRAHAAPVYLVPVPAPGEVAAVDPLRGREIALASDALWQNPHSQVRTDAGAGLQLQATAGASIRLDQTGNRFDGAVSALSGASFNTAWNAVDLLGGRQAGQSVIRLSGQVLQVGGGGVEADVLRFTVGKLGTEASSPLAARLWYNDASFGQQRSTPGLQITLLPEALAVPDSLGSVDRAVQVRVGALATGGRTEGLNAGYVQLLPKRAAGGTAVFLAGPRVGEAAYSFFQDGAGDLAEVPLFYNNVLPATPQLAGSLSAVASVSETARRERFDETVRTENVAIRLRAGVIAEVGPGRPATQGTQGLKLPSSCSPVGNLLGCGGVP